MLLIEPLTFIRDAVILLERLLNNTGEVRGKPEKHS